VCMCISRVFIIMLLVVFKLVLYHAIILFQLFNKLSATKINIQEFYEVK